jgi:chromate reductase
MPVVFGDRHFHALNLNANRRSDIIDRFAMEDRRIHRMDKIKVLGIVGSLRKESFNRKLLQAALELAPEGIELEIAEITGIPLFNEDVLEEGVPEEVRLFKERVAGADALLIATPEYNWSVPGPLKNAIDWVSRPIATSPLQGKPAAIMGASTGPFGTVRVQLHLRQVFAYTNTYLLPQPQVLVNMAEQKFDGEGKLTDEATRQHVRKLLEALEAWTRRLGK